MCNCMASTNWFSVLLKSLSVHESIMFAGKEFHNLIAKGKKEFN